MKKAKVMLMTAAAVAVVGGALAFKAANVGTFHYCTGGNNIGDLCPTLLTNFSTDQNFGVQLFFAAPNAQDGCTDITCTDRAKFVDE